MVDRTVPHGTPEGELQGDDSRIDQIFRQRGATHGDYVTQASLDQRLKAVMRSAPGFRDLEHYQQESLELISLKISRVLTGDAYEQDHWDDIQGYSRLVSDVLSSEEGEGGV